MAFGASPADRSDARHVAVEFVHPVIVGKRALPALGLAGEGGRDRAAGRARGRGRGHRDGLRRRAGHARGARGGARARLPDDRLHARLGRGVGVRPRRRSPTRSSARRSSRRSTTAVGARPHLPRPPRAARGPRGRPVHDSGASSFLYPFLGQQETDLDAILADVRKSMLLKADEIMALRAQTLTEGCDDAVTAARVLRERLDAGGRLIALGNGGSATDAMDVVADFRTPMFGGPRAARAGPHRGHGDHHRRRQRHRHRRDLPAPGHRLRARGRRAARAVDERQLAERPRGAARGRASASMVTMAFVGYDGGNVAAERPRRPHLHQPLGEHPAHPGGARQRLPRAARARRARRTAPRVSPRVSTRAGASRCGACAPASTAPCRASATGPFVYRLADELGIAGWVLNDERGVLVEAEGPPEAVEAFVARLRADAPPLAEVRGVRGRGRARSIGEPGFQIVASERGGRGDRAGHARLRDVRGLPRRARRPGRPPLPLSVSELHELRAALHDRARDPLRPADDDDGRLRHVRRLPGRVRGPARPPLPRPAQRLPGLRAAGARCSSATARRVDGATTRCAPPPTTCSPAGSSRSRASAATTSPAAPTTRRPSPRCARASTARTGRSRCSSPTSTPARALVELGDARGGAADARASGRSCSPARLAGRRRRAVGRAARARASG